MVIFIGDYIIASLNEGGDNSLTSLISGAKKKDGFFVKKLGKSCFKFLVKIDRSGEIAGA